MSLAEDTRHRCRCLLRIHCSVLLSLRRLSLLDRRFRRCRRRCPLHRSPLQKYLHIRQRLLSSPCRRLLLLRTAISITYPPPMPAPPFPVAVIRLLSSFYCYDAAVHTVSAADAGRIHAAFCFNNSARYFNCSAGYWYLTIIIHKRCRCLYPHHICHPSL